MTRCATASGPAARVSAVIGTSSAIGIPAGMWAGRADLGVEQALGPVMLRLGYRAQVLSAANYDEAFKGVYLEVSTP